MDSSINIENANFEIETKISMGLSENLLNWWNDLSQQDRDKISLALLTEKEKNTRKGIWGWIESVLPLRK